MNKTQRNNTTNHSRRKFIVGSAAAGGGLALGLNIPFGAGSAAAQGAAADTEVNAWVVVKPDDTCVIRIARSEMGQGTHTGLAQLVAEELECDWKKVSPGAHYPRPEPGAQARLARHGDRRQPRHPRLARLRPPGRRRGAHDAAAGGGQPVERAGRRVDRRQRRHHACGVGALDELRQGRRSGGEADAAGPEEHQAQEPERLESRRQADEAARHREQGERQQDLFDRPQAAGHAARRDQGVPGVRRQVEELRRVEDRGPARRGRRRPGGRYDRRRRRQYVVAGQVGARRAADRVGRRPRRQAVERDDRGASAGKA